MKDKRDWQREVSMKVIEEYLANLFADMTNISGTPETSGYERQKVVVRDRVATHTRKSLQGGAS